MAQKKRFQQEVVWNKGLHGRQNVDKQLTTKAERAQEGRYQDVFRERYTSAEMELYAALKAIEVPFKPQEPVRHYHVDALLEPKIVIEAWGRYWHGLQRRGKVDAARLEQLARWGYRVLILWEDEITVERIRGEVQRLLSEPSYQPAAPTYLT